MSNQLLLTYELTSIEEVIDRLTAGDNLTEADTATVARECNRLKKTFVHCIPGTRRALLVDYFRLHHRVVSGWSECLFEKYQVVQMMSGEKPGVTLDRVLGDLDDLILFMEVQLSDYMQQSEFLTHCRAEKEIAHLKAAVYAVQTTAGEAQLAIPDALWQAVADSLPLRRWGTAIGCWTASACCVSDEGHTTTC